MAEPAHGNGSESPKSDESGSNSFITSEQLNKAISARFKAFDTKLTKQLDGFLESIKLPTPPKDKEPDLPPKDGDADDRFAKFERSMKARQTKLENQIKERDEQIGQERSARQVERMRRVAQDELASIGIEGTRGAHALGFLVDATKKVKIGEDGSPVFVDADGLEVPLRDGLADWAKTEDAALYRAPKGSAGSGERPGQSSYTRSGNDPESKALAAVTQFLIGS